MLSLFCSIPACRFADRKSMEEAYNNDTNTDKADSYYYWSLWCNISATAWLVMSVVIMTVLLVLLLTGVISEYSPASIANSMPSI